MHAEEKVTRKLKKTVERPAPKPKTPQAEKKVKIQKKGKSFVYLSGVS